MTISTAFLLPTGILFYSDSRITYTDSEEKYKDIAQKMYSPYEKLVISFAGDVESAHIVINILSEELENLGNLEDFIKKYLVY